MMEKEIEKLTFSPNGVYMLLVVEGEEHLCHLSTSWDISTYTHTLVGAELEDVIKKLLKRL